MNCGPQHPSTHGVLRLITILNGELFQWIITEIGLLNRATEKLIEFNNSFNANFGYFSRTDYVSPLAIEFLFVSCIERLLHCYINDWTLIIRRFIVELNRILNHLLNIGSWSLDIGLLNPLLWLFEEREKLLHFQDILSGSRMHTSFTSINLFSILSYFTHYELALTLNARNVMNYLSFSFYILSDFSVDYSSRFDLPFFLFYDFYWWLIHFPIKLKELHLLLTLNRLFINRLSSIGIINYNTANHNSIFGPIIRSTGFKLDIRNIEALLRLDFNLFSSFHGDCFSRYLIRINECLESIKLINQIIYQLSFLSFYSTLLISLSRFYDFTFEYMESMIFNFNSVLISLFLFFSFTRLFIDCPKGLYSILIINNFNYGMDRPFRVDFTPNDFLAVTLLNKYCRNINLADLIAVLGSIDFVLGSVDLILLLLL